MKKIKSIMAALAVLIAVTGAFAFKPAKPIHKTTTQTLYAISTDGVNFSWVSSPPEGYSCQSATGTCEITTSVSGTPAPNTYPSSYSVVEGPDKHSAYMSN